VLDRVHGHREDLRPVGLDLGLEREVALARDRPELAAEEAVDAPLYEIVCDRGDYKPIN
jgi:hypothetical protein